MRDSKIIAAVDEEFGIGKDGGMPWHVPADFQFFKSMTYGGTVVVGRKTFENTGVLPGRQFLILTSDKSKTGECYGEDKNGRITSVRYVNSFEEVSLRSMSTPDPTWIAGGGAVYDHYVGISQDLYLSHIPGIHDCDTFFPDIDSYSAVGKVPAEGFEFKRYTLTTDGTT